MNILTKSFYKKLHYNIKITLIIIINIIMGKKSSVLSVWNRRKGLLNRMLDGETPTQLLTVWTDENPNKSKPSFAKDVAWCYDQIKRYKLRQDIDVVQHHVLMYDKNVEEARGLGLISAANQAMRYKEKLLRLHQPEEKIIIQNNTLNVGLKDISLEELKNLLNEPEN